MELEEIKVAIKGLTAEDRRKVARYILELEKQHVQETIGPQIAEDLDAVSKVVHDAVETIKQKVKDTL